ncbi:Uncharacterised protein [Vibrio cholerae]|nr:Uncharacterised protein [Vibrio cholerae]CSD66205.1 Uncharacterised protein [Vibrio cholerae]
MSIESSMIGGNDPSQDHSASSRKGIIRCTRLLIISNEVRFVENQWLCGVRVEEDVTIAIKKPLRMERLAEVSLLQRNANGR